MIPQTHTLTMTQTMAAKAPFAALGCAIWFAMDAHLKTLKEVGDRTHHQLYTALSPYLDEPDYDILLAVHECLFGIFYEGTTNSQAQKFIREIPGFDLWNYTMQESSYCSGDHEHPSFIRDRKWTNSSKLLRWMRGEYDTRNW